MAGHVVRGAAVKVGGGVPAHGRHAEFRGAPGLHHAPVHLHRRKAQAVRPGGVLLAQLLARLRRKAHAHHDGRRKSRVVLRRGGVAHGHVHPLSRDDVQLQLFRPRHPRALAFVAGGEREEQEDEGRPCAKAAGAVHQARSAEGEDADPATAEVNVRRPAFDTPRRRSHAEARRRHRAEETRRTRGMTIIPSAPPRLLLPVTAEAGRARAMRARPPSSDGSGRVQHWQMIWWPVCDSHVYWPAHVSQHE